MTTLDTLTDFLAPRRRVFVLTGAGCSMLVAGSSLMVFSGYRFALAAAKWNVPLALVNLGRTRADGEAHLKIEGRCGDVLARMVERLGLSRDVRPSGRGRIDQPD